MQLVEMNNVRFGYAKELVLKDVSFTIDENKIISIVGANGSGKSTLLKLMLGELVPQGGTVQLLGEDPSGMMDYRAVGYVPQVNAVNKIPFPVTALELVVLNLYKAFGFFKIPRKKHYEKAFEALKTLELDAYANTPFNELSGGLQQRVMIARAMINKPKLLIFDEPTAGVDKSSKDVFFDTIKALHLKERVTIVLVTHELELAKAHLEIDQVYQIENGELQHVRAI